MGMDSVFIPILPAFDKFFDETNKNLKKAGDDGGKVMAQSLADGIKRAESDVKRASEAIGRAKDRAAEKADKLKVAELQYQEVLDKGDAKASQIAAAEAKVAKARRDVESADKSVEKAVKNLANSEENLIKVNNQTADSFQATEKHAGLLDGKLGGLAKSAGAFIGGFAAFSTIKTLVVDVGGAFDGAFDAIRIGTGATGSDLEALKDSMRNVAGATPDVADGIEGIGTTLADLNTRLGLTGKPLETITSQLTELKNMGMETDVNTLSAAFKAFGVEAEAMPGALDDLFRASQATGLSIDELAAAALKGAPQLKEFGFNLGNATALVGRLDKAGVNSQQVIGAMAKAMGAFAKEGREPKEALAETVAQMQEFIDTGDRAGAIDLASRLFGVKGAGQVIQALQDGALAIDDLAGSIGATGDTILDVAAETADFPEQWALFKQQAMLAVEPIASQIFGLLAPALELVAEKLGPLVSKIQEAVDWGKQHRDLMTVLSGAALGVASAFVAVQTAQAGLFVVGKLKAVVALYKAWRAGTLLQTVAQMGLNTALLSNPIGLIVLAIGAVVGALAVFFTKTETGRKLLDSLKGQIGEFWDTLKGWGSGIADWAKGIWGGISDSFGKAWEFIKDFGGAVADVFSIFTKGDYTGGLAAFGFEEDSGLVNYLLTIRDAFLNTWEIAKGVFGFLWDAFKGVLQVVQPFGEALVWIIRQGFLFQKFLVSGMFDIAKLAIDGFVSAFVSIRDFIMPVWDWFSGVLVAGWNAAVEGMRVVFEPVANAIVTAWNWIRDGATAVWDWIREGVLWAWNMEVEGWSNAFNIAKDFILGVWETLKNALLAGWQWIDANVFTSLRVGLDVVKNAFGLAVDGVTTLWDNVRAAAAKPIKFVIQRVFNDGIVSAWNKVADWVGLDKVQPYEPEWLGAFADGGVLPGYTPGRDPYTFVEPRSGLKIGLSGGEAIMRPEWVKAVGGVAAVDAMNKTAASSGVSGVRKQLGEGAAFANGGVVGDLDKRVASLFGKLKGEHGKPYQYGGVGNPSWDCSGLWSGIVQDLNGGNLHGGRIFNTESNFGNFGFVPGLGGRVTIGVLSGKGGGANGHMAGTIDRVNIESSGDNGVQIGGRARGSDHPLFNHAYTLKEFLGKFISGGAGGGGGFFDIRAHVRNMAEAVLRPIMDAIPQFNGTLGYVPKAFAGKLKDAVLNFISDHAGSFNGGAGVSGNAETWREMAMAAMRRNGFNADDPRQVDAMIRQIQSESGGIPNRNQEIVDVNGTGAAAGQGLLQIIPGTFAAYRDPSLPNDRTDPWANMNAALRYYRARYGDDLTTTWGHGHGYDSGGWLKPTPGGFGSYFNHTGKPEAVLTEGQWARVSRLVGSVDALVAELPRILQGGPRAWNETAAHLQHLVDTGDYLGNEWFSESSPLAKAALVAHNYFKDVGNPGQFGRPDQWATHFGSAAVAGVANDVLGLFGLDGIIGGSLKQSFVDLVNAGADTASAQTGYPVGHIHAGSLQPVAVLDDNGIVVGEASRAVGVEASSGSNTTVTDKDGVEKTPVVDSSSSTTKLEVSLDPDSSYTGKQVEELLKGLNEKVRGLDVEVKGLKKGQEATVTSGLSILV